MPAPGRADGVGVRAAPGAGHGGRGRHGDADVPDQEKLVQVAKVQEAELVQVVKVQEVKLVQVVVHQEKLPVEEETHVVKPVHVRL